MPVGELFLSAVLSVLFKRLASRELWQFLCQEGLYSKIKKWERKLRMIEAVLVDAEDKQITNMAVKMWLDDLRDLAYDVEDILDEFATETLARKSKITEHNQQASSSKVQKFLPVCFGNLSPRAIKLNRSMEFAIKDVSSRLEELYELREELGLREIAGGVSSSSTAAVYQRPQTTCLPTEPAIYGRDQDKDRVIQMVMKEEQGNTRFRVTAIVGMGGLGKTTLAREVYNDTRMNDFNLRAWVCISEDFDVLRISNAILRSMTSSSCDHKDLNVVQNKLKEVVSGKKFLLVLDDMWGKDYLKWETLKSPFMSAAQGSKVIVTTRLAEVALMMNPGEFYQLKLLSHSDCWSLFTSHAFESRDTSIFHNIELIRTKVIEKSKGLPLAAKTLGGLLRCKQSEAEWLDVLNSKLWELFDETEIPIALKLSYFHLPSNLKRCFAYCAIFPKNYEFEEETVVHLWLAEGLLQIPKGSILEEDLGHAYFHDLLSRSIFQVSSNEKCKYIYGKDKYVLHDLFSDLAQWVSGNTCATFDALEDNNRQQSKLEKLRHYSCVHGIYDGKNKIEVLLGKAEQVTHLRTFLPLPNYSPSYIPQTMVYDLLSKFNKLRALSLKNYCVIELPESIGQLSHLHYLDLSNTKIRRLPESTCSLLNLQIMKLRNCSSLRQLPVMIRNLINLLHLDVRGTQLSEMPTGIRELKFLRQLTSFIVGNDSGARVKELKHLIFLCGELYISRLNNVKYPQETNEMILNDKKGIKVLQLEWDPQSDDTCNDVVEIYVLDMLQPHHSLEKLTIKGYNGVKFPRWLGNSVLSNVTVLRLEYCNRCTSLPSLGRLPMLKELTITRMKRIKSIGHELHGEGCSKPFQLLETLIFQDLREWVLWEPTKENHHVQVFPRLSRLFIVRCPKLSGKLPDNLSSLESLVIIQCTNLVVSLSSLPILCTLKIDRCNKITCSSEVVFKSLESMSLSNISECHKWFSQLHQNDDIHLEMAPLPKLRSFTLLRKLYIWNCSNLSSFPEMCCLTNLSILEIKDCYSLTSLPDGMNHKNPNLEELVIERCNSLRFIIKGQPPPSLRFMDINDCQRLECVFDDKENSAENISTSLLLNSPTVSCSSSRSQFLAANLRLRI